MPSELKDKNFFVLNYASIVQYKSLSVMGRGIGANTALTLYDLLQEFTVNRLQESWLNEYEQIPKMTELPQNFTNINGAKL